MAEVKLTDTEVNFNTLDWNLLANMLEDQQMEVNELSRKLAIEKSRLQTLKKLYVIAKKEHDPLLKVKQ